jgi:hypothetical protein
VQRGEALPEPVPRGERRRRPRVVATQSPAGTPHDVAVGGHVLPHRRGQPGQHVDQRGVGHVEAGDDVVVVLHADLAPGEVPHVAGVGRTEHGAELGKDRAHVVHRVVALDLGQPFGIPRHRRQLDGRARRLLPRREPQPLLRRQRAVLLDVVADQPDAAVSRQ